MERAQKAQVVEELGHIFSDSGAVVVCHYKGLSVAEMTDLRAQMREAGASVRVAKNRLAKIALAGKPGEGMTKFLTGPTVIAYSEDPVAPAKVAEKFAKANDKLVILGGSMGDEVMDEKGVKALAAMPSREEMLATIAAMLGAPASNLASAIGAPASNIAGILSTLEEREAA